MAPLLLLQTLLLVADGNDRPEKDRPEDNPIVVTAERDPGRVLSPELHLSVEELAARQPRTAADALMNLPGVAIRTNSRGETIARIRGGDERQTQVFLDGAPLAVPWDGRIELGFIPAGLIRTVHVAKGAVPIEYGANTVAGAIDLRTATGVEGGLEAAAGIGSQGFRDGSVLAGAPIGKGADFVIAASGLAREAEPVADLRVLPFSQSRSSRRTNSDLGALSGFAAWGLRRGALDARLSLLTVDAERGIVPESNRDPAVDPPRYWRYPAIDLTQLTLTVRVEAAPGLSLKVVSWRQWFSQRILQFADAGYSAPTQQQDDQDDTLGTRAVAVQEIGKARLRLSASVQQSRHYQIDRATGSAAETHPRRYCQNLYSIGAEIDAPLGTGRLTLGASYDRSSTPLTGDKPAYRDLDSVALSAGFRVTPAYGLTITFSGGRRTRFPTPRELFGEALGRFLVNPDLRPETSWLADVEATWSTSDLALTINPFVVRGVGTLGQRIVTSEAGRLRQRYNLTGSTTYGIDGRLQWRIGSQASLDLFATAASARADAGDAPYRRLPQRPEHEIGGAITWELAPQLELRTEFRRVGPAVDLNPAGDLERLPTGGEINIRGRIGLGSIRGLRLALTGSVENLTKEIVMPQLGLPLPGRSYRLGLRVE